VIIPEGDDFQTAAGGELAWEGGEGAGGEEEGFEFVEARDGGGERV